jgi:hypothetical protein
MSIYKLITAGVTNHKFLENVLSTYVDGYTVQYGDGFDVAFEPKFERVAIIEVFSVSDRTVNALATALAKTFKQDAVVIQRFDNVDVRFVGQHTFDHAPKPELKDEPKDVTLPGWTIQRNEFGIERLEKLDEPEGVYPTESTRWRPTRIDTGNPLGQGTNVLGEAPKQYKSGANHFGALANLLGHKAGERNPEYDHVHIENDYGVCRICAQRKAGERRVELVNPEPIWGSLDVKRPCVKRSIAELAECYTPAELSQALQDVLTLSREERDEKYVVRDGKYQERAEDVGNPTSHGRRL